MTAYIVCAAIAVTIWVLAHYAGRAISKYEQRRADMGEDAP